MRALGYLLLACVLLAAVKVALAALLVLLAIGLVWSAATRPRETAGLIGLLILSGLIRDHGLGFLIVVGIAAFTGAVRQDRAEEAKSHQMSTEPKRLN